MGDRSGEGRWNWNAEGDPWTLSLGGGGSIWVFVQGSSEFYTPLLMGPVCLLSQGRFEDLVSYIALKIYFLL